MTAFTLPKRYHPDFRQPNKKPAVAFEIDWTHPLTRGLVFCAFPELQAVNLVTGDQATSSSGSTNKPTVSGVHLDQAATTDYQYYPNTIDSIDTDFTIAIRCNLSSAANNAALLHVPFTDDATWDAPQYTMGLTRASSSNVVWVWFSSTSPRESLTEILEFGTDLDIAVVRDGTAAESTFYKNGVSQGAVGTPSFGINNSNKAPIHFGERKHQNTGEGAAGEFHYGMIWDRTLSALELAELNRDPYQILKPVTALYLFPSGAPADNVFGTSDTTNADDTSEGVGFQGAFGTSDTTNANDTSDGVGIAGSNNIGSVVTTNLNDTSEGVAVATNRGLSDTTNANDTVLAAGGVESSGISDTTNANDTSSAFGVPGDVIAGFVDVINANDTVVANGINGFLGTIDVTNINDPIAANGLFGQPPTGTTDAVNKNDTTTTVARTSNDGTLRNGTGGGADWEPGTAGNPAKVATGVPYSDGSVVYTPGT